MKQKTTAGLFAALLTAVAANGAPLTPRQALDIARDFESSATSSRMMRAPATSSSLKQVYKHTHQSSGLDAIYVFDRGKGDGYILVSGDDRVAPILGYSDKGHFDAQHIPDNMKTMLENWGNQIAWLSTHDDARALLPAKVSRSIDPLLGDIKWDQGDPYNRKCPTVTQDDGWGGDGAKAPAATGCVATALGQIMYYHQWPLQGQGSVSYTSKGETPEGKTERVNVSADFGATQYNWSAMLPSLTSKSPSDAIDAVSTLLFHVGASFESVYGASTGATDVSVAPALLKYFDYDKGINYLKRDYYTADEWNAILINELENNRPVAYGGVTRRREGHFFVLDGVNTDGYYHVNWGWSGMEDGYYLLTLLEPGAQGIGGASGGAFHYAQNMITGIRKPVEGSQYNYNFTCDGVSKVSKTVGRQESVKLTATEVWNDSPNAVTADLGFILIDSEGNTVYRQMVKSATDYDVSYGESKMTCSFVIPDNIPAGQYIVRPAYRLSVDDYATDRFMQVVPGHLSQYSVTVTEDNITYASQGAYALKIVEVKGDNEGELENGVTKKITVKVHNDGGEFFGPVQLRMFINGMDRTFGRHDFPSNNKQALWLSIAGDSDTELTFDVGKFDLPGHNDYVVRLWGNEGTFEVDEDGYTSLRGAKNLCSVTGVTVVGPALPPVVEVVDDMIVTTAVNGVVPRNDVGLKVCISNEGGEWSGKMRCAVWDPDVWSRDPMGYINFTNTVTLEAATDEQWVTLTGGEMPLACEEGKEYDLTILEPDGDDAMVPSYYVTTTIILGEAVEKVPDLKLDEVAFYPETVVAGTPVEVQFHVSNAGYAYNDQMYFTVSRNDETLHTSSAQTANVERDDEAVIVFNETFELPTASDYVVTLFDNADNVIGKQENVTFTADDSVLSLTDATDVPAVIICDEATDYIFGVQNTGFLFDSTLRFVILLDDEEKFASEPKALMLPRGGEGKVSFNETVRLEESNDYVIRLLAGDNKVGEITGISIKGFNGISDTDYDGVLVEMNRDVVRVSGADVVSIAVYSADGRCAAAVRGQNTIDLSGLSNGAYILRVETPSYVKTLKFIK